ncbi:hypothetical protein HHI36_006967, partial [Cryptolaemus montrouzieri]
TSKQIEGFKPARFFARTSPRCAGAIKIACTTNFPDKQWFSFASQKCRRVLEVEKPQNLMKPS